MRRWTSLRTAAAAFAVLLTTVAAVAQTSTPTALSASREEQIRQLRQRTWDVRAVRAKTPIKVDGRLDEPEWAQAEPISDFYQRGRRDVIPASERTEVRVLFDDIGIYVGFRCFDHEPDKVKARALFRDEAGGADDLVSVLLDAYHDHRAAIQFVTNRNGLIEDLYQLGENETTRNHDFDSIWHSKGRPLPDGFEVEIMVPFQSLRFPRYVEGDEIVFGIGFKRNIPRKNEEVIWPFVSNDSSWYRPAELGHLRGMSAVRSGRNLEFRPYVLGGGNWNRLAGMRQTRRDIGLDTKWGVTPGLTADFTVNTDFAQEEADVQQVNLTRFSLFFPEKRQFFLEGQQMFQFGVSREADLVFTRRIGLSERGEIVPLDFGARLSGRQGRTSIGAMNLQTDRVGVSPGQNFTVLRVKHDVMSRSSVGALFTNVDDGPNANRVIAADGSFRFARKYVAEGFLARMEDDRTGGATAAYARTALEGDRYGASYRLLDLDDAFRPAVGFVQRPGNRQHTGEVRFSPRPESNLIRQVHVTGTMAYITDQQGTLETRTRDAAAQVDFETGDALTLTWTNALEAIAEPFPLRTGVTLAPGTYRFDSLEAKFDTFRRRHATVNVTAVTGGFWDGERDGVSLRAAWRFSTHVGVSGSYDVNWIDLPQGSFTTHLVSSRVQLAFRSDLALLSLVQYNRDTRQLSSNIRFNWIPKPGTDFFIVYNELDGDHGGFHPRNRSLVAKLNYLFSF